eukprot:CAMPEP_0178899324 /NCGR_PEP_ID=MMETSP0786-20121207/2831_1 /TAXON_ID=186022 /ORGANISM="Thalassionema frauenfeldii, Strain CCMP 1798" /LENGTH=105 /DNA_ID=CAMNT_0020570157 /DNA_START=191 /DNA_END=508 /DNA_ORIENTATION=-
MTASGLSGFFSMQYIQQRKWERNDALYDKAKINFVDSTGLQLNNTRRTTLRFVDTDFEDGTNKVDPQEYVDIITSESTNSERVGLMTRQHMFTNCTDRHLWAAGE